MTFVAAKNKHFLIWSQTVTPDCVNSMHTVTYRMKNTHSPILRCLALRGAVVPKQLLLHTMSVAASKGGSLGEGENIFWQKNPSDISMPGPVPTLGLPWTLAEL